MTFRSKGQKPFWPSTSFLWKWLPDLNNKNPDKELQLTCFPYSILASQFKFTILVVLIVPLGFMASGQKFLEPSEFLRIFIWIELKN